MRKLLLCIPAVLLVACYPSTRITGSWKNPSVSAGKYKSVFIASLSSNNIARSTIENNLETALNPHGVKSYKSINEFPPEFRRDSITKGEIMNRVKNHQADAILTISVLKKETESRYVRGSYAPMGMFGYYGNFWGYYSYWQPHIYSPGYYTTDEIYYLETNLYDSSTEALIWSAQSETYSYHDLNGFSKQFAKIIVDRMIADGILFDGRDDDKFVKKNPQ